MSVQKRSLIGSRPAKKVTAPVKNSGPIGESKGLAASALDVRTMRFYKKSRRFVSLKGKK
jgi:hypothetical protein